MAIWMPFVPLFCPTSVESLAHLCRSYAMIHVEPAGCSFTSVHWLVRKTPVKKDTQGPHPFSKTYASSTGSSGIFMPSRINDVRMRSALALELGCELWI